MELKIRKTNKEDIDWIKEFFTSEWGGDSIISRGKIYKPENLDSFVAEENNEKLGLITFFIENGEMEIVSFNSMKQGQGIGTMLLEKVVDLGRRNKIKRIFLITTNDNLNALKFYQKRNFCLCKIYPNSMKEVRKLKPQIPEIGENGIPLRDEIEFEIIL